MVRISEAGSADLPVWPNAGAAARAAPTAPAIGPRAWRLRRVSASRTIPSFEKSGAGLLETSPLTASAALIAPGLAVMSAADPGRMYLRFTPSAAVGAASVPWGALATAPASGAVAGAASSVSSW
jgi:hypothetical protein